MRESASNSCEIESYADERKELKQKIATAKIEIDRIIQAQQTVTKICIEKDEVIRSLRIEASTENDFKYGVHRDKESSKEKDLAIDSQPNASTSDSKAVLLNDSLFKQFENCFTIVQLQIIRKIGNAKRENSTFISNILRALFAENMHQLFSITATGRTTNGQKKENIDQDKMNTLYGMFSERLTNQKNETDKLEISVRLKRLNKLINSAISNAQTASKKSKIDSLSKK